MENDMMFTMRMSTKDREHIEKLAKREGISMSRFAVLKLTDGKSLSDDAKSLLGKQKVVKRLKLLSEYFNERYRPHNMINRLMDIAWKEIQHSPSHQVNMFRHHVDLRKAYETLLECQIDVPWLKEHWKYEMKIMKLYLDDDDEFLKALRITNMIQKFIDGKIQAPHRGVDIGQEKGRSVISMDGTESRIVHKGSKMEVSQVDRAKGKHRRRED